MLGAMVVGKKQAGEAQPDVSRLAQGDKDWGPDAADAAMDAAIVSYSQKRKSENRQKDESATGQVMKLINSAFLPPVIRF